MFREKIIKVLVIVNAKFGYDGISSVATNYYRYQDRSQIQMDLLTINEIPSELENEIHKNGDEHFVVSFRNSQPFKYLKRLTNIVKLGGYNIVHVHGNSATMAVDLLGAKLGGCKIRIAHSHNTKCDHKFFNMLLMPVFKSLYTHCCACSKEAGNFLFGDRECFLVKNGIYLPKYEFSELIRNRIRKECNIDNGLVIGHIGRFSFQKNQEFLIELLYEIVNRGIDATLLLVGEGESVENVRNLAKEYNVLEHVVFYGTTNQVNEVVQAMDCFVFPSRFEGLGIVAIEAQASGLKCIISDCVPHQVDVTKTSKFISLDTPTEDWITAILQQITTSRERTENAGIVHKKMREEGFDIEKNCKDILDWYKGLIKGNK